MNLRVFTNVYVCVLVLMCHDRACVSVCVCVCLCECPHLCAHACVCGSSRAGRSEPCPELPTPRRVCVPQIVSLTELDPDVLESMYSLGCFRDRHKLTKDLQCEE